MSNPLKIIIGCMLVCAQATVAQHSPNLELRITDGGSIVTELSHDIAVNQGSSLHRRWVILNDATCPIKLGNIGVVPVYTGDGYKLTIKGDATALTDIRAVRLVFTQFDLWGSRDRGLESTTVADIAAGQPIPMEGSWYATENEVSRIFTTVAYVDQVMLPDGKIWTASRAAVAAKLRDVQLKVTEAALDPDPPKAPAAK